MNRLEQIGLDLIRKEVLNALERCSEKNNGRMEHEQIFIRGNLERALEGIKALTENNNGL